MLPISLRPNGRRAVVVGGGDVAARKAQSLAIAGFPLFVVAERIGPKMNSTLAEHAIGFAERRYESGDVRDAAIVIAATDDEKLNERIVEDARAVRALACDATQPDRGDFTMAATRRIGDLTISVDSGGRAPGFSRRVAGELAQTLGAPYAQAVRTLAHMRGYVRQNFPMRERAPILRGLAQRPIEELAAAPQQLCCATRRSELAMIQSRSVAAALAQRAIETAFLGVTTAGDRDRTTPIDQLGSVNVFVKELENALRERRADFAVHSCKDLPGVLPGDLRIAAISRRADARDAFCSERYAAFDALPPGALVGTSSPRRRTQLAALRPDLRYEPLRGNVDTRLRKLASGEYDAIVLAMAGLERLGASAAHVVPFDVEQVVPAVGQGALAVEIRSDDERLCELLRETVNDAQSELCITCERAALAALRAGCSAPLGIHARLLGSEMTVFAAYAPQTGSLARVRMEASCREPEEARALGEALAARLRAANAVTGVHR
jgi:hydroxymethylbilane synthase